MALIGTKIVTTLRASVILVLSLSPSALADVPASYDSFLTEINQTKRIAGETQADITPVVGKYFPSGMELKTAEDYLQRQGFKASRYKGKEVKSGEVWLIAERHQPYRLIMTEKIRVILESDGTQVLRARGWLFLMS